MKPEVVLLQYGPEVAQIAGWDAQTDPVEMCQWLPPLSGMSTRGAGRGTAEAATASRYRLLAAGVLRLAATWVDWDNPWDEPAMLVAAADRLDPAQPFGWAAFDRWLALECPGGLWLGGDSPLTGRGGGMPQLASWDRPRWVHAVLAFRASRGRAGFRDLIRWASRHERPAVGEVGPIRAIPPPLTPGLIRCVFPAPTVLGVDLTPDASKWWRWRTADAVQLAGVAWESRDFSSLPILADALQDAGCGDARLLSHLRGLGPHCRGCWAVEWLLR